MLLINNLNKQDNVQQYLLEKLNTLQGKSAYPEIAQFLSSSLNHNSSKVNRQVFGYIPSLFREIKLNNWHDGVFNCSSLPIGEPVIFKISFPHEQSMRGIPFFYLFCYIKENPCNLNVYFQSAMVISNSLKQKDYGISQGKIAFEGIMSAFTEPESVICISDPGHFIPGLKSSFYVGTQSINFVSLISNIIEAICSSAKIKLENTLLFGSSAGGMGALLSSTYFDSKVQVLSVNTQIYTHNLSRVMKVLLGTDNRQTLVKKFGDRVSCLHRFKQNLNHVPNIYLLANVNDPLYQRNYKFYQLYQKLFIARGQENQSVFDSYYGVEGHGRPNKVSLKKKIRIARESLMMNSNL